MQYLRGTKEMPLILEASKALVIKWFIDGLYAVHADMKSHTGTMMTLGHRAAYGNSSKQKINMKSSIKAEVMVFATCLAKSSGPDTAWRHRGTRCRRKDCTRTISVPCYLRRTGRPPAASKPIISTSATSLYRIGLLVARWQWSTAQPNTW